ncbi:hypothetical protein ABPG74_005134 [Tetrahymena malaccensis]
MKKSTIYLACAIIFFYLSIASCGQESKILDFKKIYQITQNQTAENFQINLLPRDVGLDYLIIEINIISTLYSATQLISCLNFNQNAMDQQSYQNTTCQYSDIQASQEQLTQRLLIINANDLIYSNRATAFLTIFYTNYFVDNAIQDFQLPYLIQYNIYIYQQNDQPCHNQCNQNGFCNNKVGKCQCQSQLYGIDCSKELKNLNISETQNVFISSKQQSFFLIKFGEILVNSKGNSTDINLKKQNGTSVIYFQTIFNKLTLPSIHNNNISQVIHGNEIAVLQNVERTCLEYQRENNIKNYTQLDNCYAVISVQQSIQHEPTLLSISVQYSIKKIEDQQEQSQQNGENTNTKIIIIISSIFGAMALFIFTFVLVRIIKRKASNQNRNQQNQQIALSQIFQNCQINVDVTKAKILFLQEAFMPILEDDSLNKQNELQTIQVKQETDQGLLAEKQVQNQNNQNIAIDDFVIEDKMEGDKQQKHGQHSQRINAKDLKNKDDAQAQDNNFCSICLVEIGVQDKLRLTICKHLFHSDCLITWISQNENCPLCRQSFLIADILEYLVTIQINKHTTVEQVSEIQNEKNKIIETLLKEKNNNLSISDFELLSIFKYFLPQQTLKKYQLIQDDSNQQSNDNKVNTNKEYSAQTPQVKNKKKFSIQIGSQSPISMLSSMALNQQFTGMLESHGSPFNETRRTSIMQ